MKDISTELHWIMLEKHCSPMQALCFLATEVSQDGVHNIQPKSDTKTCRRLRNKGNFKDNEQIMGRCLS